jgi:2-polyprenyl-3-methyl-5-hydroxy-6-metoxy-1,4-benzoquinol methylase
MRNEVLQLLEAALAFAPTRDFPGAQFRVEWNEPAKGAASEAVKKLQFEYQESLPDKKKEYLAASVPRFRFVAAAAVKYFAPKGKVLDLGCAPGFVSIVLHHLGFEPHGVDLNKLWEDTYPDRKWIEELHVQAVDAERAPLPFADGTFDGAIFTEVLEHIAIVDPVVVIREIVRVLKPGAMVLLTTPNVCNLANLIALAQGKNIFWAPEIFYGSTDRHNREYTPAEVVATVERSGLEIVDKFLFNGPNNWNGASGDHIYESLDLLRGLDSPLLGNTVFIVARRRIE